jgi:hypothetical protein
MIPILETNIEGYSLLKTNMFNYVRIKDKRVKGREIQSLHCSKRFNFSNAYSAQDFI